DEGSPPRRMLMSMERSRAPQCFGDRLARRDFAIKLLHQLRRGLIVDLPQCDDDAPGSCREKCVRQPNHTLAANTQAQGSLARGQRHELGAQSLTANRSE